jgi:O-Antigen ligase
MRTAEGRSSLRDAVASARQAVQGRPSFALYLAALALFPFKWLSPFSYDRAGWTDAFFAAATAVWALEAVRAGKAVRLRPPHYAYAAYLAAGALSALFASSNLDVGALNVLIIAELVAIAVLTSDYARDPARRSAIVLVILAVTFVTTAEAALGLVLFYMDVPSSLVGGYGDAPTSDLYRRVAAGFHSAPLLGSFCIFASAMLAREDAGIPRSIRRGGQVMLALVVLMTFSRAVIGFAVAVALRTAHGHRSVRARRFVAAFAIASIVVMAALTVGYVNNDPSRRSTPRYELFATSSNTRLQEFVSSLSTFAEHPVLGSGPGSLPGKFRGEPFRAHFTPLNVAATLGLPALAALAFLVVALWRRRRRPTDAAIWSGLAGLGVDALGQDVEHFRHVWIMFGLADADRSGAESREPSQPDGESPCSRPVRA